MTKLVSRAALLFSLVTFSLPLHAQGSVYLQVCNAGKVDIDVFVSQMGKVSNSHIGLADCASVAKSVGAMGPAYVGLGFVDSRGQWGAARRLDLLADLGNDVLSRANQSATVRHGNNNVPLTMQMLFKPHSPGCTTTSSPSAVASLPLGASPAQVRAARAQDVGRSPSTTSSSCEALGYTLNVEAYPESSEITFRQECDPCDKKADARLTPEERAARQRQAAAANQVIGTLSKLGPAGAIFGSVIDRERQEAEEERKARESRLSATQRMNWNDLLTALRKPGTKIWEKIPRNIIIRGTVSGVEVSKDPFEPIEWVDVAFRESPITDVGPNRRPYSEFNVCASGRDIFTSVFGPAFLSSMIGKTIEVEGETQGAYCRGLRGSIRVTLAHQVRPVASAN